ncbi:hypothetical protein ACHWQZ_G016662 [Mnemiopsis leidyi]
MGIFKGLTFMQNKKGTRTKNSSKRSKSAISSVAALSSNVTFKSEVQILVDERNRKLDVLKNMELLVIDNSLRETTVASIKAHTVESKRAIFREIKRCGFKYYFVEAFNTETRMGDLFLEELIADKEDLSGAFAFCEMWERLEDGVPLPDIPVSLQKCKKFGIMNVMIEFDLMYHKVNYEKFDMDKLCRYIKERIDWIRANLSQKSLIFVNIRDFSNTMKHHPGRVWHVVHFLSTLPPEERVTGIAYEDMGKALMDHLAVWTKAVRNEMIRCGWEDGQFIFHVHEQWGMMHATNLECLANGATGIWCAVCTEGAAMGHADSCTTILNMIRLGNTTVQKQYNCKYLRDAAIRVTEIASGNSPDPRTPIYGDCALDMLFGGTFTAMGEDPTICEGFDMAEFLGVKRVVRVTTMASGEMIVLKLKELFGKNDQFTEELGEEMRKQILENAAEGRREEYNSVVGLAMLFDQAGGFITPEMAAAIEKSLDAAPHILILIEEIKEEWDKWDSKDGDVDNQLTFDNFYVGFMAPYFGCYRCEDTQLGLKAIDMDNDGMVDWIEFKFYLIWAGRQYPEVKNSQDLLDKAFRFGLIPAMKDECDRIRGKS